jgi:hypothetical protein
MKIMECSDSNCLMALNNICRCSCGGENHGSEKWRNYYLPKDHYLLKPFTEIIVKPRIIKIGNSKFEEFIKK